MKLPDRLLHDVVVLRFMAKLWIGLSVALTTLLWAVSGATGPAAFDPWEAIVRVVSTLASALLALLVIGIGGKLFVSLFRIARNDPDRIIRAAPWLFESEDVLQQKQNAGSTKPLG